MEINTIAFAATKVDAENRGLSSSDASTVAVTASLLGPNPVVSLLVGRAMADRKLAAAAQTPAASERITVVPPPRQEGGDAGGPEVPPLPPDFNDQMKQMQDTVLEFIGDAKQRLTAVQAAADSARVAAESAQKTAEETKKLVEAHASTSS